MKRALVVGDSVVIRPDAVEALKREGYRDVKAHVPARITDVDDCGRRLFYLDNGYGNFLALGYCTVWPSQIRLANGTAERASVATEKRVAEMVAAKAEREAARRIPGNRRRT